MTPGPTHICGNKIDLILRNTPEIIKNVTTTKPDLIKFPTDHYIVDFQIQLKLNRAKPVSRRAFDYKRGDF